MTPDRLYVSGRYRPGPDWRRPAAFAASVAAQLAIVYLATPWGGRHTAPVQPPPMVAVFDVNQSADETHPEQEIPVGPRQIERLAADAQKPEEIERPHPDPLPPPPVPAERPVQPTIEAATAAAVPVPETTAPPTAVAPPGPQPAVSAEKTWEALLMARLERFRRYPRGAGGRGGVVHVRFRMKRDGAILSMSVARSSGSALLDEAALDTLRRAQPLPSIPIERPATIELSLPIAFFVGWATSGRA